MKITEIRIFPKEGRDKKLKAYVTVIFDDVFVVRNIKIIQGLETLFIAMPSTKARVPCQECRFRNEVGNKFCNNCGSLIKTEHMSLTHTDSKSEHRDIAHPITQQFRKYLQTEILEVYEKEGAGNATETPLASSLNLKN